MSPDRHMKALGMVVVMVLGLLACTPKTEGLRPMGDGLDPSSIPDEVRPDYNLFAQRCSKCHSLSRALDNGHVEDRFWQLYVERMRRQPGSGISHEDVPGILRFLHFYAEQIKASSEPAK